MSPAVSKSNDVKLKKNTTIVLFKKLGNVKNFIRVEGCSSGEGCLQFAIHHLYYPTVDYTLVMIHRVPSRFAIPTPPEIRG